MECHAGLSLTQDTHELLAGGRRHFTLATARSQDRNPSLVPDQEVSSGEGSEAGDGDGAIEGRGDVYPLPYRRNRPTAVTTRRESAPSPGAGTAGTPRGSGGS